MEAVAATATPADETLDVRARAGDREAFRSLYDPQFEGVYDYVLRIVCDREIAADVVRTTFAKGRRSFAEQGNDVAAWLFATARACALDALRYRRDRNGGVREALQFTGVDGDRMPDAALVFDRELVELVWDTAAALPRDEYSLLALHVRHDLPVEAIGEHLCLNGTASFRLTRVCASFDEAVVCELVARRARHSCSELDFVVRQDDRRRVAQHIKRCTSCRESSKAFVSASAVLGALAPLEPEHGLRREIFGKARRRRVFGIL
jgi:DNA-directed RNA polymerase specialized sigma24 family protein